ncbi:hypothetical protein IFM89_006303 [Coptis chinensis]|uniref:Uncharacterized protein n=1 Tax=Coptis chinensis TaxID=261450 RepID=A0A835IAI0_9MAGN|nr:hypothetical protein IFM89_006303 [Coptis chinensis]
MEPCVGDIDSYVTDHALVLDFLINTADDVAPILWNYYCYNWLGSHEEVAEMYNNLGRGAASSCIFLTLSLHLFPSLCGFFLILLHVFTITGVVFGCTAATNGTNKWYTSHMVFIVLTAIFQGSVFVLIFTRSGEFLGELKSYVREEDGVTILRLAGSLCILIFYLEWVVLSLVFALRYYAYVEGDKSTNSSRKRIAKIFLDSFEIFQEQKSDIVELRQLKIKTVEINMLNISINSLQAERKKLQEEIAEGAAARKELEMARNRIKELQRYQDSTFSVVLHICALLPRENGGSHGSSRTTMTNTKDDWDAVATTEELKALKGELVSLKLGNG